MHQSVPLNKIKPNPFRRLDQFPLDPLKVEKLKSSISRTDFWDNVIARQRDSHYELAYGHHRIEATRQVKGKDATVNLIVRDLDDTAMLKMMAADNDDAYAMVPGFILEAVQAAKELPRRWPS